MTSPVLRCMPHDDLQSASRIEVLWQDNAALVLNKPAGLSTQAARGIESLETHLVQWLRLSSGAAPDDHPYVAFAHRIDRPVSGAILVARNVRAAKRFGGQFQSRKVDKVYWALVEGNVAAESATWMDWMRKVPGRAEAELVAETHPEAKQAILSYRVLCRLKLTGDQRVSLLRIELETGRTHQIRLQCASRGFPLLGDQQYGATQSFGPDVDDPRQRAIALHARSLTFLHPRTGVKVNVLAPLWEAWNILPAELFLAEVSG